jgi:GH18 family chitinase
LRSKTRAREGTEDATQDVITTHREIMKGITNESIGGWSNTEPLHSIAHSHFTLCTLRCAFFERRTQNPELSAKRRNFKQNVPTFSKMTQLSAKL